MQILIVQYPAPYGALVNAILAIFIGGYLLAIVTLLLLPKNLSARIEAGEGAEQLGAYSLTLSEEHLVHESARQKTAATYDTIVKITQHKDLLIILHAPTEGYIIPKKAFASSAQMKEFVAILTKKTGQKLS